MDENLIDVPVNQLFNEGVTPTTNVAADGNAPSGNELIDATQHAIIDAAENVTQIFETAENVNAENIRKEPIYLEVEFWVGVASVLTFLLLLKPLVKFIKAGLQNRIKRVVDDLNEAVSLRDDAQVMLADYERKFINADKEAKLIMTNVKTSLKNMKKQEKMRMQNYLKAKDNDLNRYMLAATEKVKDEINFSTSKRATYIAQSAINNYLHKTDKSKLIDEAIDELDKLI